MSDVTIIIPTNRPWQVLAPCLRSIAAQTHDPAEIEVIAVFNGIEPADGAHPADWPFRLVVERLPQANIAAAKNVALDRASGQLLILLNDDVRLRTDFVQQHLDAQRRGGEPGFVLGQALWQTHPNDTLFDLLIQATPMIFGYCDLQPRRRHDFRQAWNLNLSLRREVLGSMRFDERLGPFFYEDLELAFRLQQRLGPCVWYEPNALCIHEHRYTLDSYLQREAAMGPAAVRLWNANPSCFRAIFKTDLDDSYQQYCRQYVRNECGREAELRGLLEQAARRPASWLGVREEALPELTRLMYHAHLPLKRLVFRRALLEALELNWAVAEQEAVPA